MQSADYVPGVSGWKIDKGVIEINGGPWGSVRIGDLDKVDDCKLPVDEPQPEPFIVVDGVTYISEVFIADASIKVAGIKSQFLVDPAKYSIKLEPGQDGRPFCAGLGLGLSFDGCFRPDILVKAERIEILPDGMVRIKPQS